MVKVQGPMMSLSASGSLAKTVTFSSWKGRPYVRELVKPANPKSALQVSMRAMFKFLSQQWAGLSSANQATWDDAAEQITASAFNAFVRANQARWRSYLSPSKDDPAVNGTDDATFATWTATAGVREISVEYLVSEVTYTAWGLAIHRSTTMGFTPSISNVVAVVEALDGAGAIYVDGPLDPDTYYYRGSTFDETGKFNTIATEISATIV